MGKISLGNGIHVLFPTSKKWFKSCTLLCNWLISPFLSGRGISVPHEMLFCLAGASAITGTKDGLAWACGILQSTQWISLHRGRDCRICLGEVGDFSPLVTGSLVDRFHAVFVVVQIWAVWDKFGTWGYLRYLDSRISWCSCWRAMAILIILGWATQCIPRKSLANMSCEKMWILSAENGLIMMWRCYRPVPSHPDMGFDLVGLFGKKPSSPVIWTWMLNVC